MTAAAPRFAFAYAAETLLGEVFATSGGCLSPREPAPEGMQWEISIRATSVETGVASRLDPDFNTDELYVEFSPAWWDGFLGFLSGMPYTDAFFTVCLREATGDYPEPAAELTMHYATHGLGRPGIEAGPGVGFHTFDLSLDGNGRPADVLALVADPSVATRFVAAMAARFPVTFGSILDGEPSYSWTGWDRACGVMMHDSLAQSRDYLRGYAWITYVPGSLLVEIGGVSAASASGVFHSVRELPGWLVELQATEAPAGYGLRQVRSVHEFLEPLLAPNEPRPPYRADRMCFIPQAAHLWE